VRRHAEGDDLVILAVLLEFERVVALMAVGNEQTYCTYSTLFCMLIIVLQPLQTKLICSPAVLRDSNNPIVRCAALLVPGREVVLALEDDEGRDCPCLAFMFSTSRQFLRAEGKIIKILLTGHDAVAALGTL
jgi:hypothetical protein